MKNTKSIKVLACSLFLVLGLTALSGCSSSSEQPTVEPLDTWSTVLQQQ